MQGTHPQLITSVHNFIICFPIVRIQFCVQFQEGDRARELFAMNKQDFVKFEFKMHYGYM